jgi:hypothetical protein
MNIAHQPGSEPLTIPEQIPNPAVRPVEPPSPEPKPVPQEPVKVPEKVPADRVLMLLQCTRPRRGGMSSIAHERTRRWSTNAHDAELLERYGCYSGTRSAFCQR